MLVRACDAAGFEAATAASVSHLHNNVSKRRRDHGLIILFCCIVLFEPGGVFLHPFPFLRLLLPLAHGRGASSLCQCSLRCAPTSAQVGCRRDSHGVGVPGTMKWVFDMFNWAKKLEKVKKWGEVSNVVGQIFEHMGDPLENVSWGRKCNECRNLWCRALREEGKLEEGLALAREGAREARDLLYHALDEENRWWCRFCCTDMLNMRVNFLDRLGRRQDIEREVEGSDDECGPVLRITSKTLQDAPFKNASLRFLILEKLIFFRIFSTAARARSLSSIECPSERAEEASRIVREVYEIEAFAESDEAMEILQRGVEEQLRRGNQLLPAVQKCDVWKREAFRQIGAAIRDGGFPELALDLRKKSLDFADGNSVSVLPLLCPISPLFLTRMCH